MAGAYVQHIIWASTSGLKMSSALPNMSWNGDGSIVPCTSVHDEGSSRRLHAAVRYAASKMIFVMSVHFVFRVIYLMFLVFVIFMLFMLHGIVFVHRFPFLSPPSVRGDHRSNQRFWAYLNIGKMAYITKYRPSKIGFHNAHNVCDKWMVSCVPLSGFEWIVKRAPIRSARSYMPSNPK